MDEKTRAIAVLSEGKIHIDLASQPQAQSLVGRSFGEKSDGGRLELPSWEALYLLREGMIEVQDEATGQKLDFNKLLEVFSEKDEAVWPKYLVYRDLRSRGYVVKPGFGGGLDFRVYERGAYGKQPSRFLVLTVSEGKPLPVGQLAKALETAQKAKKEVIIAVVERRGEVVYYSLSSFTSASQQP